MNETHNEAVPPISVLIVEDTRSLLRLYANILEQTEYRVLTAESGKSALHLLETERPDIILLDRVLPDMDGSEICALIKENQETAATYVIMLSALLVSEDDRVSGLEAGADDYMVKPVGRRELLARIKVAARIKRMQLALACSEANFRTLAENSPDVICRFDQQRRFTYINSTVEKISGRKPSEYIGKTIEDLDRHEELVAEWLAAIDDVCTSREAQRIGFKLPTRNGVRVIDAHLVPEFDSQNNISSVLSVARDFTEHAKAEQQIARLATVIEQATDAVIITDRRGGVVYANAAFETITGLPAENCYGLLLQDLHDLYSDNFCEEFATVIKTEKRWQGSTRCRLNQGICSDVDVSAFPIYNRNNELIDFAVIQRDVTQRKRTEREREALLTVATALRNADTRAAILSIITVKLLSVLPIQSALFLSPPDENGVCEVQMASGNCANSRGQLFNSEEVQQIHLKEFGNVSDESFPHNSSNSSSRSPIATVMGEPTTVAAVQLESQGKEIGMLWIGGSEPLGQQSQRIMNAIGDMAATAIRRADLYEESLRYAANLELKVAERTQELATANEQLLELDRLKSKFVSNVSHELRTPISNLKLYMDLLRRGKPERRSKYEAMLRTSVDRLGQLVEDILNLSRIEIAHQRKSTLEPTDLNGVISQVVSLHEPMAESAGVQLLFESDPSLPLINGDYNQLSQLATNLIANALNYTKEGYVRVATSTNGDDSIRLIVEDTGIGILEDDLPHLFDRFYRGGHSELDDIPGTGLGLAIVHEIVDIHDGSISVESEVNNGTCFKVTLPTAPVDDDVSVSWLR